MFGVTRNMGSVQSKVIAVNMLIQNDFLKANRLKNSRFLSPIRGPIRALLSTVYECGFCAVIERPQRACQSVRLACRRGLASKGLASKQGRARLM
jgi:hypothetical protein